MKKLIVLPFLLLLVGVGFGQMQKQTKKFLSDYYYNVYFPSHEPAKGVILFLHGSGEVGSTAESINGPTGPERNEIPKMLLDTIEYPYIFIVPQLHSGLTDWPKGVIDALFPILDVYEGLPKHVTGLSLGGRAVHLAIRQALLYHGKPGYFTTAGAVCGSTSTIDTAALRAYSGGLYVHLWHGLLDTTVKPGPDNTLFKALTPLISDHVQLTTYANDGHQIWPKVYRQEYFQWLKTIEDKLTPAQPLVEMINKLVVIGGNLYLETDKGNKYATQLTKLN